MNTNVSGCGCTKTACCGAYHEVRIEGALHPDIKTFLADRAEKRLRLWHRHAPDGTPIAERVEQLAEDGTVKIALECGLALYATDAEALTAAGMAS